MIPLPVLRKSCPCAACRSQREDTAAIGLPVVRDADGQRRMVTAEKAELVGRYALRITWQDGHDTGIYDYNLLRALGQTEGA